MLYPNQITKIRPNYNIPEVVHGGGLEAISKKKLVPLWKSPMTNETYVLIGERPKFRVVILSESATCQKKEISYLKVGHF